MEGVCGIERHVLNETLHMTNDTPGLRNGMNQDITPQFSHRRGRSFASIMPF
jgi:hypothetical protein